MGLHFWFHCPQDFIALLHLTNYGSELLYSHWLYSSMNYKARRWALKHARNTAQLRPQLRCHFRARTSFELYCLVYFTIFQFIRTSSLFNIKLLFDLLLTSGGADICKWRFKRLHKFRTNSYYSLVGLYFVTQLQFGLLIRYLPHNKS